MAAHRAPANIDAELKVEVSAMRYDGPMDSGIRRQQNYAFEHKILLLERENAELRMALKTEWLINHDERCTNMKDCESFTNGLGKCHYPRPPILSTPTPPLDGAASVSAAPSTPPASAPCAALASERPDA